jgi:hypothetical protein
MEAGMKPYRPVALLLLVLHVGACSSWRPLPVSPREYIETEPTSVRITTLDGTRVVLPEPAIANDSIHGNICALLVFQAGELVCTETSETQRYALADITGLEWIGVTFTPLLITVAAIFAVSTLVWIFGGA